MAAGDREHGRGDRIAGQGGEALDQPRAGERLAARVPASTLLVVRDHDVSDPEAARPAYEQPITAGVDRSHALADNLDQHQVPPRGDHDAGAQGGKHGREGDAASNAHDTSG
jgi:hypothetical protein